MSRVAAHRSLLRDDKGAYAVEFALVVPAFLMFIFLILEGGQMLFKKQALNELAAASARCMAVGACTSDNISQWAKDHGAIKQITVVPTPSVCSADMAGVTITTPFDKGALGLLPQSVVPSTLTSSSCFPMVS